MEKGKILVVDGDIAFSEMLTNRLEASGYHVDCARGGKEALNILKSKWIDLVVMDVLFRGGISGYRLFKELRRKKEFLRIPVVIQSSRAGMKRAFKAMGAKSFFIKPYDMELALSEIADMLTRKILVFGDDEEVAGAVARDFGRHNIRIDIISGVDKFYVNIASRAYSLIIVQHAMGGRPVDRLISIVRDSGKNNRTPVVVYPSPEIPAGARGAKLLRGRYERFELCEFMDIRRSNKNFLKTAKRYIKQS